MIEWNVLDNLEQLDKIDKDSFTQVQAIFKHSTTCPISHMAKNRLESSWNLSDITAHYLDLKAYRSVSNAVADRWTVHHESPQIILVKDGKAIFDESHLDINIAAIASSVK